MAAFRSQRKFAEALGVAASTLGGYLKRDDWPVGRKPPWSEADRAAIERWRASLQEDRSGKSEPPSAGDTAGMSPRQKADYLIRLHRARKLKAEADLAEGKVIGRSLHEAAMAALATLFVQSGSDTFERLPHQLPGDPAKLEAVCRSAWSELRERILDQGALELDRVDAQVRAGLDKRRGGGGGRGRPAI